MAYYNICPRCGAHLDPGEKCDCKEKEYMIRYLAGDRTIYVTQTGTNKDDAKRKFYKKHYGRIIEMIPCYAE